jgi:pimeloyl-ACP methyl ester carboxylesterase
MAAIVDALDGPDAKLNYWAFSYGTIHLVEFIQTFPSRVGRVIADGVFDAEANALTYVSQLPNDQIFVRDAMNDLISFCETAGSTNCPLSSPPTSVTSALKDRIDGIFEDLFLKPIDYSGVSISLDTFSPFFWSFQRVPSTWSKLSHILGGLETRNATLLMDLLLSQAASEPSDPSAPGVGSLNKFVLLCVDNADSTSITIHEIINLTKTVSIAEDTPLLAADLTKLSYCRHFPATRPLIPNLGVSLMNQTDTILGASNTTILILNAAHDSTTPLNSAKHLRSLLRSSSILNIRSGPGHTTVSLVSLSLAQTIHDFFVSGTLPEDLAYHSTDQDLFPTGAGESVVEASATYNGTGYTDTELGLMDATYDVFLAFLAIS